MAFLSGLNGGNIGDSKKAVSSSRFLGGIRKLSGREQQLRSYQAEADKAKTEAERLNAPGSIAMETLKGIPGVLRDVGKALVDDPMKTLATPVIRAEQAALTGIGMATGNENLQRAANAPLEFPSIFGGSGGTIESQRSWEEGGAKQIAGDTAKYAATVYTGGKVAPIAKTGFLGQITKAGLQGAKEGAIGGGLYMGGDELQRQDSTLESTLAETAKGVGFGGGAGLVLGAGGAALARPGALSRAAEAEAKRMRPLPVQNLNEPTMYHGSRTEDIETLEPKAPMEFAQRIHGIEGQPSISLTPSRDFARAYTDPLPNPEKGIYEVSAPKNTLDLDAGSPDALEYIRINSAEMPDGMVGQHWITTKKGYDFLKSKGYDSVSVKDNPNEIGRAGIDKTEVRVFEPTPVRPGVNIRRFKTLDVQDQNIAPGRTRANARSVNITREAEPYIPESELPVIKAGRTPKATGEEIGTIKPPEVYTPEVKTNVQLKTPAVVKTTPIISLEKFIKKNYGSPLYHGTLSSVKDLKPGVGVGRRIKYSALDDFRIKPPKVYEAKSQSVKSTKEKIQPKTTTKKTYTDIGVTSFRGKPVTTINDTKAYYNTPRAKGFENMLNMSFKQYNLPTPNVEKSAGWWEGSIEPSFLVRLKVKISDDVRAYAVAAAKKANQDAVILFSNTKGDSVKYTFSGKPEKILAALKKNGISGATVQGDKVFVYDIDGSISKNVAQTARELKVLPTKEKGHGELIFKDDYEKYTKNRDSIRTKDGQTQTTKQNIQPQRRTFPVTMDIPKRVASVETKPIHKGQAVTTSKVALDANKKLVELGYDSIPEEQLARIGSINKKDQIEKVTKLLDDPRAIDMAAGIEPIPDGVAPQVLFNAVMNKAVKENDFATITRLARSKIAEELSTAAQTLGSAGFNREPLNPVTAIKEITDARVSAKERRRQSFDVKKEAKVGDTAMKKVVAKKTWDDVINSLTC